MQSTQELRSLEKEIQRTKRHLINLQARYQKVKTKKETRSTERARLEVLKREIERENPSIIFTPSNVKLLKLVGSLPYSRLEKDKEDNYMAT